MLICGKILEINQISVGLDDSNLLRRQQTDEDKETEKLELKTNLTNYQILLIKIC